MSPRISLELFCKHAFKKTRPPPGYETLSQDIISIAGGLPLFLEVVGSLLYGEEKPIWEEKLVQLRKVSLKGVAERLKISYDVLEAETQQIFLDIACFCIGMEKEIAIYMWSDLKYLSLLSRINSLIQRSMIKIGYDNKFQMHDQMRDMGREIVREENIEQPWKRSRIWDPEEALDLLQNKREAEKLKVLDLSGIYLDDDVKFLEFPESGSLEMLNLSGCHTDKEVDITRLWNLKVLNLQGIQLKAIRGGTIGMLEMLRELNLTNFKCGNLKEVIVDIKELSSLKILKTIGAGVPDKPMGIKLPTSLNVLHTSFWFVNLVELLELEELEVEDCDFGLEIPHPNSSTWSKVSKLTSLTLSPLSSPPAPSALLPSSLAKLHVSLVVLEWLPSLEKLENLTELVVRNCNKLREIRGLQDLKLLRTLVVDGNRGLLRLFGLVKLVCLNKLQTLEVTNCPRLAAAFHDDDGGGGHNNNNNNPPPTTIDSLQHLHIHGCESLLRHGGWLPHLSHFPKLKIVEFGAITSSTNNDDEKNHNKVAVESLVDGIACLEELEKLRLFSLPPSIEILPSLSRLQKLTNLAIHDMPSLREIQGIADLKSLERLMLAGCTSLERLIISRTTTGLRRLKELDIRGCINLAPQDLSALRANLPDARIKWPDERYPDSEPWSWGYCSVQ
ncbi:unnamed protein product [Linum tenue]|uniref:Disease resistance protein Roq1-like winged-helix domain-containing protein n=1 Tax=Linum tenue TaxID=586396 RepID=A0AAV0K8W0_9ROSI|nr:unnamed protein product [Linum tenue]